MSNMAGHSSSIWNIVYCEFKYVARQLIESSYLFADNNKYTRAAEMMKCGN